MFVAVEETDVAAGKTVSTANFNETGNVNASAPETKPQSKPRVNLSLYG
jgi:hypothetical protein